MNTHVCVIHVALRIKTHISFIHSFVGIMHLFTLIAFSSIVSCKAATQEHSLFQFSLSRCWDMRGGRKVNDYIRQDVIFDFQNMVVSFGIYPKDKFNVGLTMKKG